MIPRAWQILPLFQNFSKIVTGSALYVSIALFLALYFVPKQTAYIFGLLK